MYKLQSQELPVLPGLTPHLYASQALSSNHLPAIIQYSPPMLCQAVLYLYNHCLSFRVVVGYALENTFHL